MKLYEGGKADQCEAIKTTMSEIESKIKKITKIINR